MMKLRAMAVAAVLGLPLTIFPVTRGALAQTSPQSSSKQKAIADLKVQASDGDPGAQIALGVVYLTGDGLPKDDTQALAWFRKAADQDNPLAERYLAEMYFKGRGVPVDDREAAKWLSLSAAQGDPQSQYNLAVLYTQGLGVSRDLKVALNWMQKAADQGLAAGQLGLGVIFENGQGAAPDPVEAEKWFQKAVDQNNVEAMNDLAMLLATSYNKEIRDPQRAIALATKAVAAGSNPDYLDTLAAAYFAAGQIDNAIQTEQKALDRAPENDSYQKALEKYLAAAHGTTQP